MCFQAVKMLRGRWRRVRKKAEYIDKNESVDESYLQNWYIDSVDEAVTPHWTEEHIEELVKDFTVIPIETPSADVEPVTHAEWEYDGADRRCSNCGAIVEEDEWLNHNWYYCYHCGAKME